MLFISHSWYSDRVRDAFVQRAKDVNILIDEVDITVSLVLTTLDKYLFVYLIIIIFLNILIIYMTNLMLLYISETELFGYLFILRIHLILGFQL